MLYKCRPSTLFGIIDDYTAYCFDEACGFIQSKISNDEEPNFDRKKEPKHYSSFTELYAQYE